MRIIRKMTVCFLILFIQPYLFGCADGFNTANINLYRKTLSEVQAHSSAAYFLSTDGTLYCTGADSDSSSYVVYQNQTKGIVAENVNSFGELVGGGYYIDHNNNLYIWNRNLLPLYGYTEKKNHMKILEGVKFVSASTYCMIYIDITSNLYLIGDFDNQEHSIDNPKLLAKNVTCANICDNAIYWATDKGIICSYGATDTLALNKLNDVVKGTTITDIFLTKNYFAVLSDNNLWFYGDYKQLISGKATSKHTLIKLTQDIERVSCSYRTIGAIDSNGNMFIWGRCISNDEKQTNLPKFEYFEAKSIAKNAKNICVSDSCVSYIDVEGNSQIYYSGGWIDFYGNSTNDLYVGIKRDPCTWVK